MKDTESESKEEGRTDLLFVKSSCGEGQTGPVRQKQWKLLRDQFS